MSIDFWHFCEDLTVVQSVLLILGCAPSEINDDVLKEAPFFKLVGFDAIFSGITQAIKNEKLKAILHYRAWEVNRYVNVMDGENAFISDVKTINYAKARIAYKTKPDWHSTTVNVDDLKQWLASINYKPAFFFDEQTSHVPDYLDPNHPRYSPKLAASVKVWQAMEDDELLSGKGAISAMRDWLESRYKELGLTFRDN